MKDNSLSINDFNKQIRLKLTKQTLLSFLYLTYLTDNILEINLNSQN